MAEEVINSKVALKGCFTTGCLSVLIMIIIAALYLVYVFYIDDSVDFGL
ncbi:hypothetical protein [Maribacter sp. 2210JD10-5]